VPLYTKWFGSNAAARPADLPKRTDRDSECFIEMDWCSGRDFRDALKRHFEPAISDFLCP